MDAVPDLFSRLPATLFGPLTGPLAALYWDVLARFYQQDFESEASFLVRPVALEIAEASLRASPAWLERREELLAPDPTDAEEPAAPGVDAEGALARAAARRLVSRLEAAGWFYFEYRSAVGQVLNFHPYSARLLDLLLRLARDEQPAFQGFAHSIATLLRADTFAARPGLSLAEARRHTQDLVRELKILDRNIFAFTQRLLDEVTGAAQVLEESLDHYQSAVNANYHRLKTVDNLYKWRGEILSRLDEIERDALSLESATRFYAEQGSDLESARARVRDDLRVLRSQFESLAGLTEDIDVRNARFSGVALRKLMYLLRQDRRVEGQLQLLIDRLARDQAPELPFDVYRCELLADGFLYRPPRKRAAPVAQPLPARPVVDLEALRRTAAARVRRPFSRERIQRYVDLLLGHRDRVPLAEAAVEGDEDYVRLVYTVAYGLGPAPYRFERREGREQKGVYGFPAGDLVRAKKAKKK